MQEETFEDIFDWLNRRERKFTEKLAKKLKTAHPTLQQCFVRSIREVFAEYAKTQYTDARNESAVEFAEIIAKNKEIARLVGELAEENNVSLPLI